MCVWWRPNTLKKFVLDAYEHIGLQILAMHDHFRNLIHINGQVLNNVGACIWLMAYNSCKDEGAKPKSGKTRLNLHGPILEGK